MQTSNSAEVAARPERNIFSYWNGQRQVHADPLTIHRNIIKVFDGDPNTVLKNTKSENRLGVAYPATEKLMAGIRIVFSMPAIDDDGNGATEGECFAALDDFLDWQEKKRTNGGTSPTLPPPSTASPDQSPTNA